MECERFELGISLSSSSTVACSRFAPTGNGRDPLGHARLRKALWMVVLQRFAAGAWLSQYYEQLRGRRQNRHGRHIAAILKLLAAVRNVATHRQTLGADLSAS